MEILNLKTNAESSKDFVSLGEILLRFDPGERRIQEARQFQVWDGGAEYNVARNLSRVFGQRTSIVTALADNALGRLAEDFARQGGVNTENIIWREEGAGARNGIYFIERGFGLRAPASSFDRANTAVSHLKSGDIDWQAVFGAGDGTRWFHTGGVFTGLSETAPEVALEAMQKARESGALVSYDLNYRHSLWGKRGGREASNRVNRKLLPLADVVFGVFDFDSTLSKYDQNVFQVAAEKMFAEFPNLRVVVSTLRETRSASFHDLSAVCAAGGEIFKARAYRDIQVLDRVGSGDAFASGFIYGLLAGEDLQFAAECGAAHGALAMTMPGDASAATVEEVLSLMRGEGAGAKR